MNICISTCDKTLYTIDVFQYFFNKYWNTNQKVTILGYKAPDFKLAGNFTFVSLGEDRGPHYFSADLLNYLNSLNDKYIIHAWDDAPVINKVDISKITAMKKFMKENSTFKKACLTPDLVSRGNLSVNEIFAKVAPGVGYKLATTWQMWDIEYFKKYLALNYSPWDFEIKASKESNSDGFEVFGYKTDCPVNTCNLVRGGKGGTTFIRNSFYKNLGNYPGYSHMFDEDRKVCLEIFKKHNKKVSRRDR